MFAKLADEKYYRKFYFQDSFYAQCLDIDPMTMVHFDATVASLKKIINEYPIFKTVDHVIAAGCGDSNIVGFGAKAAFEYYLPEVEYEAVEAIELSRHYTFGKEDYSNTLITCVSYSGSIYRTLEAMEQCNRHGATTLGMTSNPDSNIAKKSDIYFNTSIPKGDNNAGNRTYCANLISMMVLAACIAEVKTGKEYIPELREQIQKYHDEFMAELTQIDETAFKAAIHWMDKKYIECVGDGPMFWAGKFIQAKIMEVSGDACSVVDSDYYMQVNRYLKPANEYCALALINSNDSNIQSMADAVNDMMAQGREVMLYSDKTPEELGIENVTFYSRTPMPCKEFNFLAPIYSYLPGAFFSGFRHTTIGEPMFRGGFDSRIFIPTYFSAIEVPDID